MRIMIACAGAALSISLALAGCTQAPDSEVRAGIRSHAVDSCLAAARRNPDAGHFDWPRLCGCAIDRYMAGKNTSDLQSTDPHDPALRSATQRCAMEQVVGGAAAAPDAAENGTNSAD